MDILISVGAPLLTAGLLFVLDRWVKSTSDELEAMRDLVMAMERFNNERIENLESRISSLEQKAG